MNLEEADTPEQWEHANVECVEEWQAGLSLHFYRQGVWPSAFLLDDIGRTNLKSEGKCAAVRLARIKPDWQ